jgi:hypothetical protein
MSSGHLLGVFIPTPSALSGRNKPKRFFAEKERCARLVMLLLLRCDCQKG